MSPEAAKSMSVHPTSIGSCSCDNSTRRNESVMINNGGVDNDGDGDGGRHDKQKLPIIELSAALESPRKANDANDAHGQTECRQL
jgi:hypothetical protein